MMQHLVHRQRKCVVVAEHGHGERVTDKSNVDASLVDQAGRCVVVRSQASNRFVEKLLFANGGGGYFAARCADGRKTHDVLQCPSATSG